MFKILKASAVCVCNIRALNRQNFEIDSLLCMTD